MVKQSFFFFFYKENIPLISLILNCKNKKIIIYRLLSVDTNTRICYNVDMYRTVATRRQSCVNFILYFIFRR